jgi:hypothetical protein
MATATAARGGRREGPAERLAELVVLGGMGLLALAFVLPLAVVALPVLGTLWGLRARSWRLKGPMVAACGLPALGALLWAYLAGGTPPPDVALGYVDVQVDAAVALAQAWRGGDVGAFDWRGYGLAVAPYALAGGALLGAVAWLGMHTLTCFSGSEGMKALKLHDLGKLAAEDETPVAWALPRIIGRKVITLVSAPPGGGKGWWIQALVRAMQDVAGGRAADFYGLPVTPMKILWCTEEGESVTATARRFGVESGRVEILRREQVDAYAWPALVKAVRREAWRHRCQIVVFDTIRAWCPQAEKSPEDANAVMTVVRQQLTGPGLAAVFVHHDRKGGGAFGEGVSGTYGLPGAVDVLVELRRVSDDPKDPRRRMVVSRRFGDLDVTARLEGHRYVADRHREAPQDDEQQQATPSVPSVPSHLRRTLGTLTDAGRSLTVKELLAAEGGSESGLLKRLKALEAMGLADRAGAGVKGDPERWRRASAKAGAVRDDPAYVAYLKSAEWLVKRAQVLHRAGGRCERCHGAEAVEVHHLTYERVGDELPGDLIALCAPCHRRAHPPLPPTGAA